MDKNVDCHSGQEISQNSEMAKNVDLLTQQKMPQNSSEGENVFHGKDITQMSSEDLKYHFVSSGVEFSSKMGENFKSCLFIAASKGTESLDVVVQMITYFNGYKMHRTVGCSQRIYHLYVRYEDEYIAIAARDLFRSKQFHAEIVDNMLRLWYAFEKASEPANCQTIAWLTNANGKYVTSESANLVLSKYGNPEIKVVVDKTVKVSFNSLAEAFGACIALGPWFYNNMLKDPNYYSVKIELSHHTSKIMRMCNMTNVAREFDYFVQKDPSVYSKSKVSSHSDETEIDQPNKILKETKPDQPVKVLSRNSDKRPNKIGQKNRNGGRIFRRNHGNIPFAHDPFAHDQNRWSPQAFL